MSATLGSFSLPSNLQPSSTCFFFFFSSRRRHSEFQGGWSSGLCSSDPGGWTDRQLPDGTVILTAPTAHTYTSEPHGAAMFPALAQPTGQLPLSIVEKPSPYRYLMIDRKSVG